MRALVSISSVAALSTFAGGCISLYGDISDLEDSVAVNESERPDGMTSDQYAVGFGFGGNAGDGVDFITVGNTPGGIGRLSFDAAGALSSEGQPTPGDITLDTRPPVVGITDGDPNGNTILVGMRRNDGTGFIGLFSPLALDGTVGGLSVPAAPTGVAVGGTIVGPGVGPDVVSAGGDQLTVVDDFQNTAVSASCDLVGVRNVVVADFVAGGDLEIGVMNGTSFGVATSLADVAPPACDPLAGVAELNAGAGEAFAENAVVGDFDGNGLPDVAISDHGADQVFVILNPDGLNAPTFETLQGAAGSTFGTSIAAGDLDGDGSDELVIGASNGAAKDVSGSGVVKIFGHNGTSMAEVAELSRAEPESGDLYGRAVGVATFSNGRNIVLVASNGKVFVNFRDPLGAPDPRTGQ